MKFNFIFGLSTLCVMFASCEAIRMRRNLEGASGAEGWVSGYTEFLNSSGEGGNDISCGAHNNQEDLEGACNSNPACQGYSYDEGNWHCMKTTAGEGGYDSDGIWYMKPQECLNSMDESASHVSGDSDELVLEFSTISETTSLDIYSNANCSLATGIYGTWTNSTVSDCDFYTYRVDVNDALEHCGFTTTETAQYEEFSGSFLIDTIKDVIVGDETIEQSQSDSVQPYFRLLNSIDLTTSVLEIYYSGVIELFSELSGINFDATDERLNIVIITEISNPYMLTGEALEIISGWTIVSLTEVPSLLNGLTCDGTSDKCYQAFELEIERELKCADVSVLDLDRDYVIQYNITCQSTFVGTCNVSETLQIEFSTDSDNYCRSLIDTEVLLGTIAVYEDDLHTILQSQFLWETVAYFKIDVDAVAEIDSAIIEKLTIVDGGATDNLVLYTNDGTTIDLKTHDTSNALSVVDDLDGDSVNEKELIFELAFNEIISGAEEGVFENTKIEAVVRVDFKNSTTRRMLATNDKRSMSNSESNTVQVDTIVGVKRPESESRLHLLGLIGVAGVGLVAFVAVGKKRKTRKVSKECGTVPVTEAV